MTVTENWDDHNCTADEVFSYGHLSDFLKSDILTSSAVDCEFEPWSSQPKDYKFHWGKGDDRNCNYGHPKMADVESGKNNDAAQQKL
jgi:hypothetical protein